ncbi:helicase C-terminal domain-containing protein [Methanobrevibacter sp.]|uniref:helicase C-terminal domain-containing protein n=1 Tax=Methanobrevibacter sp. TaxID=66852 RepID=UPI00386ADF06
MAQPNFILMWQYSTYSKIDSRIRRHFPFEKPRKDQLETASQIIEAIDEGYRYIVLEAGTGTGKSAIAYTLSSIFDESYILTVTKQLQDQYLRDFSNLNLVKGRGNFTCKRDSQLTCDEGRCIAEGEICDSSKCDYYLQKQDALNSKCVISNYHYMFLELNYVGDFTRRNLLICDEAHNLENVLMGQLTLEFSMSDLKQYLKLEITDEILYELENGDFDVWLLFIEEIKDRYQRELEKFMNLKRPHLAEKISFIKKQIADCIRFRENISQDPYSWIFDFNRHNESIEFKPLKVDSYAENTLFKYGDVCIFMSASILDYEFFSRCLGIRSDEIYAIRRKSPFDMKRNPIKSFDGFDLSHKRITENAPKTVDVIKDILNRHKNEKGIIHTVSTTCKDFLFENINSLRLIDHNTRNRSSQLEHFINSSEPLVLISPSMNEGVDLPGDLCRFQIIYKLPYPDLADKQIRLRANADEDWYDYKTALSLIQTYGRGMRFDRDYCTTYFIDSRLRQFCLNDRFIPDSFKYLLKQSNLDD